MKPEFFRHFFGKLSIIKFHENPCSGSRGFHVDGQTNRQADIMKLNSRFSQLYERAFTGDTIHFLKEMRKILSVEKKTN